MSYLANLVLKKRYFVGLLLLTVLFILALPGFADLSLGEDRGVFLDLAVTLIYLFSVIFAAVYGFSRPIKQAVAQILLLNIFLFFLALLVSSRAYGGFNFDLFFGEVVILAEALIFFLIGLFFNYFAKNNMTRIRKLLFAFIIVCLVSVSAVVKYITDFQFGAHRAAADIVWVGTVQYYGDLAQSPHPKTKKYLDLVSSLDPHFCRPYSFGIIAFLDKGQFSPAIDYGRKGVANCPDDWAIAFFLGAVYNKSGDEVNAARYFDLSAQNPLSPDQVKTSAVNYRQNNLK